MLKWVVERVDGDGEAVDTPIGHVPDAPTRSTGRASTSTTPRWPSCSRSTPRPGGARSPSIEGHYEFIGERLPQEMRDELEQLEKRLAE